jgi:rare lipoprotein A
MRRKRRNLNLNTPLGICLLAGASSVALAALVFVLATRPVQADAPRPAQPPAVVAMVQGATPATLAAHGRGRETTHTKTAMLHGLASWYGGVFDGHETASGERFDMYAMTACHPTLPFGSLVRVINRRNHRSVVVRITDRGDLGHQGRVIDLSYGAAEKLAMVRSGLAPVDLQVLRMGMGAGGQ